MLVVKKVWRYIYLSPIVSLFAILTIMRVLFLRKKIFILNTPVHGNLGDQAILLAELEMIRDVLPRYGVIILPNKICKKYPSVVARLVNDSPVCIQGGGHLGDLWPEEDKTIRLLLQNLKDNKILFFPQTFYSNNENKYFKEAGNLFDRDNLYVFSRDRRTYNLLRKNLKCRVLLSPDVVLYRTSRTYAKNDSVVVCLRNDTEKTMSIDTESEIMDAISGHNTMRIDTVVDKFVLSHNRNQSVNSRLKEIGLSRLLITDRLHGMIFAYLSNTPCLVFNSESPKVRGVYEWIKKSDYIIFYDKNASVKKQVDRMLNTHFRYNHSVSRTSFDNLKECLLNISKYDRYSKGD